MKHILLFSCLLFVSRSFGWMAEPPDTIYGSTALCENSGNITYMTDPINGTLSYSWSVPSGWTIVSGDGTTSIIVDPGNAGDNGEISVSALDSTGSSAAFSMDVSVNPLPEVYAGEDTTLCAGQFPYTFMGSGNADSYNWPGNPPTISVPAWATAVLIGTLNGCTNSDTVQIHIGFCGGLDENDAAFSVYPNPASETVFIDGIFLLETIDYSIYSSDGRLVSTGLFRSDIPAIVLDSIKPGSYFICIGSSTVPLEIVR